MTKIHDVVWSNGEIGIVQSDEELLVCHLNCAVRGRIGTGWWMVRPTSYEKLDGTWICAGVGCEFEMTNHRTHLNRCPVKDGKRDIEWWVAQWVGVHPSFVEVSINYGKS